MFLGAWDHLISQYKEVTGNRRRWGFILGLFLIFLQCLIAVGNAVLTQCMFEQFDVQSPFLMTYIGISMLTLLLPVHYMAPESSLSSQVLCDEGAFTEACGSAEYPAEIAESASFDSLVDDLQRASTSYVHIVDIASRRTEDLISNHQRKWNHRKHVIAAILLTPGMFGADWAFNASLMNTSVSSATVIISFQSVIVYIMAITLKLESSSGMKCLGVFFGILGTTLTAIHDEVNADESDPECYDEDSIIDIATTTKGDVLATIAAILYASYAIQVRLYCPENENLYSLQLLLGYIGLVSMVAAAPLVIITATTSPTATLALLSGHILGLFFVKGLFDFIVSDYLLFRSIVLTSPTIASVGMALAIPMAFISDMILHWDENVVLDWYSISGATACLVGFLLVNIDHPGAHDASDKENITTDDKEQELVHPSMKEGTLT